MKDRARKILNKFEIKEGCEDNEMAKEENFKSKLKNLFGIKERTNAASFHRPQTKELLFTPEILKVCTCIICRISLFDNFVIM